MREPGGEVPQGTQVTIVEVGPRDGLQNEEVHIPTERKIAFIEALVEAGHRRIEVTAFVSPKAIPQLADADAVASHLPEVPGVTYTALVPNELGVRRAARTDVTQWAVFTAASETFNQRNIRCSIEESFERFEAVLSAAQTRGVSVRGYCSTVIHCPFEGPIPPHRTVAVVQRLVDLGCEEVSLGETIGKATPNEVRRLCRELRSAGLLDRCAGHFHDTYGMGVANSLAAFEEGVRTFDASAGGLGGCPYAPGAAGNTATEDLLFLFAGLGCETGIDLGRQVQATRVIEEALGRPLTSRTYRAATCQTPGPRDGHLEMS